LNIETAAKKIKIWNVQGVLVKEENIIPNKINSISLKTLPNGLYYGLYFIQAIKDNKSILQNFIKL